MKKKLSILALVTLCSTLFLSWCKKTEEIKTIQEWDMVTINYDSYLLDWEIIEENVTQTIIIWEENSFPIFDTELLWLKSWDTKTFTTNTPEEWYGINYDDLKIQKISTTIINTVWIEPKIWEQINLWDNFKWIILDTSPINITVDFNDRQTRENAEFNVTVLSIEKVSNLE